MSTLDKFHKLKQDQNKARKEMEQAIRRENKLHAEERRRLYNKFVAFIKPFHKQTINKHKIKLEFNAKNTSLKVFIDGKFYTTFVIETKFNPCNCSQCADGGWGHEGQYTHDLESYSVKKNGAREDGPYLSWYQSQTEEEFVRAFDEFLEEYDSELKWGNVYDE